MKNFREDRFAMVGNHSEEKLEMPQSNRMVMEMTKNMKRIVDIFVDHSEFVVLALQLDDVYWKSILGVAGEKSASR